MLDDLTPWDLRVLMHSEDEFAATKEWTRMMPSKVCKFDNIVIFRGVLRGCDYAPLRKEIIVTSVFPPENILNPQKIPKCIEMNIREK